MEKQSDRLDSLEPRIVNLTIPDVPFQVNEAINTLRGNIQLSGFDIKTICITSSFKHEGKSSLSLRLAKSFAALGKKTLFMDCDIRNSQTMSRYEVKRRKKIKGLTEYLCGEIEMDEAIWETSEAHMDIIFTGAVAPNPSELFSGELFTELLKAMRDRYDYVIVDTPPVNAVIDGVLTAKQCDGTVLIVESGVSDRRQVQHAKQQLDFAGVKLLGVVLNKVGNRNGAYGYGYGYGYGQRYGYGYGYGYGQDEDEDKKKRRKKK